MTNHRIVLITGANQGIGLQTAKELAARNCIVFVGSRDFARGEAAAKTIEGDARAIQLDVTDAKSIAVAAARIEREAGRLDVLINNAAISNTSFKAGMNLQEYFKTTRASTASLTEVRAVWETNVFGPLAVYQAMLPLLRKSTAARIVNVSSGMGSLTSNLDKNFPFRAGFSPVYAASKTALNAMTVAMALELESEGIKVNAVTPGFTRTVLNNFEGPETLEQGAAEAVRVALAGDEVPTGTFTHATMGALPW
ncbi:MAG: SDR family NAD(P)-dependent oxidoreductase [Archangiaceae bacterium]|nr:SDR family NAD(P)-dependent oxidoreductase [Archangiaceae bacterium]